MGLFDEISRNPYARQMFISAQEAAVSRAAQQAQTEIATRVIRHRKRVESCDVTSVAHKQITGAVEAVKEAQENAK